MPIDRKKLAQYRNAVRKSGKVVSVSEDYGDDKTKARVSFEAEGKTAKKGKHAAPSLRDSVEVTRELARRMKLGDKITVTTETKVNHAGGE